MEDHRTKELLATQSWIEFFDSIYKALFGWKRSFTASLTVDFGPIAAGGEATQVLAVPGARQGDAVVVTPRSAVVGLGADGIVTANDVVTVRRFNFSTAGIDPASDSFRVVVLQQ